MSVFKELKELILTNLPHHHFIENKDTNKCNTTAPPSFPPPPHGCTQQAGVNIAE